MGIFDRFPYSSTHEMNLDFMLGKATEIAESLQEVQDGLSDIDTHKARAEQAAQAAQASQAAASASAGQAAQHVTDAEDAADRAEAASNLADDAVEQAQTAAQNASTAADSAIASATAAENRINAAASQAQTDVQTAANSAVASATAAETRINAAAAQAQTDVQTAAAGATASATAAETRINTLAASLPEDFTDLNNEVNTMNTYVLGNGTLLLEWTRGSINVTTGVDSSGNSRMRCAKFYAAKGTTVTVDSATYSYWIYKYNLKTGTYTKVSDAYATMGETYTADEDCYIRVVMIITDSSEDIPTADIPAIATHLIVTEYGIANRVKDNTESIENPYYYQTTFPDLGLERGKGIDATTGQDTTNPNRARTKNYINGLDRIEISIATGYKFVVQHYYNDTTDATTWVTTYNNQIPTGTYRIVVAHNNLNTTFTEQDIIDCALTVRTTKKSNNLEDFLSLKFNKEQPDKINKFLYVDSNGEITGVNLAMDPAAPVLARVGTYNIGHYHEGQQTPAGTPETAANFRKAIADMGVSLLGINENDDYFDADSTQTPRDMVFANWKYYNVGPLQTYSKNGFASDYALTNVGKLEFSQTTRYAWYANVNIGGKSVHMVSAHLDFNDITKRRTQINTLIAHCNEYERCIIMGDFNPFNYTANSYNDDGQDEAVWKADYKIWTDAGYKLANDGYLGKLETIVTTAVHGWQGMPCDNIIVTSNIEIRQIGMISMDYMHDHRPIWADLVIY